MIAPPASRRSWTLDQGTAWRASSRSNLVVTAAGALTLQPLTGRAQMIAGFPADRRRLAAGLAADRHGRLLVLDAAMADVLRVRLDTTPLSVEAMPSIGGEGWQARQLQAPRGLAILPSGDLAIADTGNHRVQVVAATTATLLHVLGARDSAGRPRAGSGPLEFDDPWDVAADSNGTLYVADRGNARIQRIAPDGRWRADLGVGALSGPARIAIGPRQRIAVVDHGDRTTARVFIPTRRLPRVLPIEDPSSVAFAPDGTLYVGDERGTLHTFVESSPGRFDLSGSAPTGVTRAIVALMLYGSPPRLVLVVEAPEDAVEATGGDAAAPARTLWTVDPQGGRALEGVLTTYPIDGGVERHGWTRVRLRATVPPGTSILIESATSEEAAPTIEPSWNRSLLAGNANPDCLVQSPPGRYLRLRIVLRSNSRVAPGVDGIEVSLGGGGLLQYLPAVFQEDEESRQFLERFLAIFQSGFDDLNAQVDGLSELFDPRRTGAANLPWLAQLVGLFGDPGWSEAQLRERLAGAVAGYRRRGTIDGLVDAVRAYARVDAHVVEHFRLRQLARLSATSTLDGSASVWSRDRTQRLQLGSYSQVGRFRLVSYPEPAIEALDWGAHRFTVLFHSDPYAVVDTAARVRRVVDREKPAHTEASVCPVFPRLRLGVQARVGVDALVGDISYTVLSRTSTLNYDTVLAGSVHQRALATHGSALRPRVGLSTRLP